jgi:molybdopterin molybdotransferase
MTLTPWQEARAAAVAAVRPLTPRPVDVREALGLVLAADAVAARDLPATPVAAMDGVAVRAADTPGTLPLAGERHAGTAPGVLAPGTAVRIATGAPLPDGADTVVRREEVTEAAGHVTVGATAAGRDVRAAGSQLRSGEVLADAGSVLTPGHLAVLLGGGTRRVSAHPAPTVGVLVSGDEVVRALPGADAEVTDVNGPVLTSRVAALGAHALDLGLVEDDPQVLRSRLEEAAERCDLVLVTGGTSVGTHDHLHDVLAASGDARAWRLALRPAKPLVSGAVRGTGVLGLPGNPNAARVSFELFARPALAVLAGRPADEGWVTARLTSAVERRSDGRAHVVPVRCDRHDAVVEVAACGSADLRGLAAADGLLVVPDSDGLAAGSTVRVLALTQAAAAGPARRT